MAASLLAAGAQPVSIEVEEGPYEVRVASRNRVEGPRYRRCGCCRQRPLVKLLCPLPYATRPTKGTSLAFSLICIN